MQIVRWPINSKDAAYMKLRQHQNRATIGRSKAEEWMRSKLAATGLRWTRQAQWGYRLFDFWCHEIGTAVEVDGPEHNSSRDRFRDDYIFDRSGIVVLRVHNFDEADAAKALVEISKSGSWSERRESLKKEGKVNNSVRTQFWRRQNVLEFNFSKEARP